MPNIGNYDPREYLPKGKEAALKAIELDPNLAEAHAALGNIFAIIHTIGKKPNAHT